MAQKQKNKENYGAIQISLLLLLLYRVAMWRSLSPPTTSCRFVVCLLHLFVLEVVTDAVLQIHTHS